LFAFCGNAFAQKTNKKKSTAAETTRTMDSHSKSFTDSTFLQHLAKVYSDSTFIFMDSLLPDTGYINTMGKQPLVDSGEIVSFYKQLLLKPLGWTSDFEHIFTAAQIRELDSIVSQFEKETTNEIAIVTIDSTQTTKDKFDDFIPGLHNNWGVGKKIKNNGIVIGISAGLRSIRISNGYGIEPKLSDTETKKIIDNIIVPEYKKGNYFEGTKKGLLLIMQKIR
jgi:uncharacterized protein